MTRSVPSRLLTILRAAHCRSTHHFFALDALQSIETQQGMRLAKILLKYHDDYLVGAKAPDASFRDFQNHVLHVEDNWWGGALSKCEEWFQRALEYLDEKRWKKAAYACGVLSHYVSDPMMPLHTGQSDRESHVHRPMEWSICKSYEAIYELSQSSPVTKPNANGDDWLAKVVKRGAELAHSHYDRLIDIYDLESGCRNPPEGLNLESHEILAQVFREVLGGWALVLERLADETCSDLPPVSLSVTSFLATIDMPLAWIVRRISDANEKRAVTKIFNELQSTGTLRKNLPKETGIVRVERKRQPELGSAYRGGTKKTRASSRPETPNEKRQEIHAMIAEVTGARVERVASNGAPKASRSGSAEISPTGNKGVAEDATVGFESELVDAPSIGPKTAKRFAAIEVHTIGQFVSSNPDELVQRLNTRWITVDLVEQWQTQAKLVCLVPALCGYKAQLLVAAGCTSREQLAKANAYDLGLAIEEICGTSEGKRILRSSRVPQKDDVAEWITSAKNSTMELSAVGMKSNASLVKAA